METQQTPEFSNWLKSLKDMRTVKVIAMRILRLQGGLFGDVEPVGDGVSELRIHYGPGYRLYFKQRGEEIVILLVGGDKDSQRRDIKKAKEIASRYDR